MGMHFDYPAAVIAFENALRDYPDTRYAEEMEFLAIKAQFLYAQNSSYLKQEERYQEVLSKYVAFAEAYPESKYLKEAEGYSKDSEKGIEQAKKIVAQFTPAQKKEQEEEDRKQPEPIAPQG